MSDDLKVVLLSEPAGVELESCVYEGRLIFCAPPGETFSIQITAKDSAKFQNLLSSHDRKSLLVFGIQLSVKIDGIGLGCSKNLDTLNGAKFSYMYNKTGKYKLKFKEAPDDGNEDIAAMKANEAKQWASKAAKDPRAEQVVGTTKKFWQRPSAAVEQGQRTRDRLLPNYEKTYFPGPASSGSTTVWYHIPTVFGIFKNLGNHGAPSAAAQPFNHNSDAGDNGEVVAVQQPVVPVHKAAELVDLTHNAVGAAGSSASAAAAAPAASGAVRRGHRSAVTATDDNGVIDLMNSDVEDHQPAKRPRQVQQYTGDINQEVAAAQAAIDSFSA